jgi:hypothetical protein
MIAEGVLSYDLGLMDASGAGLAAFITRHYGADGFVGASRSQVSFDELMIGCGRYPMMIGGRRWGAGGHWSGLRAYDGGRDLLLLANPAAGYIGINQEMNRDQFERLGPFSAVSVTHPDLTTVIVDPTPVPPPCPTPPPLVALEEQIAAQQRYIAELETRLGVASVDYARDLDGLARGVANVSAALKALHPPP